MKRSNNITSGRTTSWADNHNNERLSGKAFAQVLHPQWSGGGSGGQVHRRTGGFGHSHDSNEPLPCSSRSRSFC